MNSVYIAFLFFIAIIYLGRDVKNEKDFTIFVLHFYYCMLRKHRKSCKWYLNNGARS